jgi:hypothetical protein
VDCNSLICLLQSVEVCPLFWILKLRIRKDHMKIYFFYVRDEIWQKWLNVRLLFALTSLSRNVLVGRVWTAKCRFGRRPKLIVFVFFPGQSPNQQVPRPFLGFKLMGRVKLTTQLRLTSMLGMSGSVSTVPLHAFMAWTKKHFYLLHRKY